MKTIVPKAKEIKRAWHLIDLEGQTLGRVSTQIATYLMGKHKTNFVANIDCGDYVVVINAAKVAVTGKKVTDKIYRHHTMHPGGFREIAFKDVQEKDPRRIIETAVKGMLPKNKLRDLRMKRLKIYVNATHPYEKQMKETHAE